MWAIHAAVRLCCGSSTLQPKVACNLAAPNGVFSWRRGAVKLLGGVAALTSTHVRTSGRVHFWLHPMGCSAGGEVLSGSVLEWRRQPPMHKHTCKKKVVGDPRFFLLRTRTQTPCGGHLGFRSLSRELSGSVLEWRRQPPMHKHTCKKKVVGDPRFFLLRTRTQTPCGGHLGFRSLNPKP